MERGQPTASGGAREGRWSGRKVRRALARRFPRLHWLYNWVRVQGTHYLRRSLALFSPRRSIATYRWLRQLLGTLQRRRSEPRLTVAVEVTALWEHLTGVGWYLYRLLEALAEREDVAIRLYGPTVVDSPDLVSPHVELPRGAALERVLHQVPDGLVLPQGLVIRLMRRLEPLLIAADGNEVVFAPNYFLPRRFRLAGGARVVTVHDLGLRTVPWTLRDETLRELTDKLEHSIFEATRIITVSEAIKDELAHYGYAEPQRVRAVHHGPGHLSEVTPEGLPTGVPASFALHVGTLEPRKNIKMLMDAWRQLRRRQPEAPHLVFCGRFGWKAEEIRTEIERAAHEGWAHHLGYVSEEELAALYREAALVVFPSLYEGFGLPAVEAFWAGTPLVCSRIPALASLSWERAGQLTLEVWNAAAGREATAETEPEP
jgi:alpha-1,3-rhamnosyl/mannosyltransferase